MGTEPQDLAVTQMADAFLAQKTARDIAQAQGFTQAESDELALVATELASNLVKHASGGGLILTPLGDAGRIGLQIEAQDHGPGIADIDQAVSDGFSTGGGLGYGLGTVNRLMDELDITSTPERGTRIVCRRWSRRGRYALTKRHLEFGVATRARHFASQNGDAFIIKEWDDHLLAGVIDGLGHGPHAQRAAQMARQFVEAHYDQPLDAIFRGVARGCRSTRGVVMALARFDSDTHLSFASIGNVEARVWGSPRPLNFIVQRGILGANAPSPRITEHPWSLDHMLLLYSDGLKTHWQWADFPGLEREPAQVIVQRLLRTLAREEDDATVVVIKGRTR